MYEPRVDEARCSSSDFRFGISNDVCIDEIPSPESSWYAVWTRSRQEKATSNFLDGLGVQHYLPLKSELRQWSDRRQMVETPVFSGYLFVHINLMTKSRLQVLKSPGVVALVGNQSGPLPIPDQEIEDIRTVLAAKVAYSLHPSLQNGDRVRVVRGVLAGVEGVLIRNSPESRLLVSVDMIRQSLAVSVSAEDVERVYIKPVQKKIWANDLALSIRS